MELASTIGSRLFLIIAISLTLTAAIGAQTCPTAIEGYPEIRFLKPLDRGCINDGDGRYCSLICYYEITTRRSPRSGMSLTAGWYPVKPTNIVFSGQHCGGTPIIQNYFSRETYAYVIVAGLDTFDQIDPTKTARSLLSQIEQFGAPCPARPRPSPAPTLRPSPSPSPVAGGMAMDSSPTCLENWARLNKLSLRSIDISQQLEYLKNAAANLVASREQMAVLDELTKALGMRNYVGKHKDLIDRLRTSADDRARFAVQYGINSDNDAVVLARRAQQTIANRIEYLSRPSAIVNRLNADKQLTEKEIARLRSEIDSRGCSFLQRSCDDIKGTWNFFTVDDNSADVWNFTPMGFGRYSAMDTTGQRSGTASVNATEVGTDEVMLSWKQTAGAPTSLSGNYRFVLRPNCAEGIGQSRVVGIDGPRALRATLDAANIAVFEVGKFYTIVFAGKAYYAQYQLDATGRSPLDLFYYQVKRPDGQQIIQDGQPLWGRFVRDPAMTFSDQSKVTKWAVVWVLKDGRWVSETTKDAKYDVR